MKCPIEKSDLNDHTEAGAAFHYCGECHGMFFTKEQLLSCLRGGQLSAEFSGEPKVSYDVTQMVVERCCPQCQSTTMVDKILDDVAIDICPECKGVWLDSGELDKIIERHKKKNGGEQNATDSKNDIWNVDDAGLAATSFFEGSDEWLTDIGSSVAEFFTIDL